MANLLVSAEDFTDAVNWVTGGSITRTADTHVAPNGAITADTISHDNPFQPLYQQVAVAAGTQYTFSFYAKAGSGTANHYAIYDNSNGADIVGQTQYDGLINSSTWTRVAVTFTTPAGCTSIWCMVGRNSGPGSVILWGGYLNTGAAAEDYPGVGGGLAVLMHVLKPISRRIAALLGY